MDSSFLIGRWQLAHNRSVLLNTPLWHIADSSKVMKKCQGVAVFHLLRDGLRSSIASGSGIMAMRLPNGKWSDAAAVLVNYTAALPPDVDVVDIVLIIRDKHNVAALSNPNANDWTPIESVSGPTPRASSAPDVPPTATQSKAPVWSYAKSKGHVLVDFELQGLSIRDSTSENEKFYGIPGVTAQEILAGKVKAPSGGSDYLGKTLRAIDKEEDDYCGLPAAGKCPGDRRVKPASM